MITHNIATMTAKVDAHLAADLLVQGEYYDANTGKGCFIGCLAHGNRPETLAAEYGIPLMLTRVLESIFEGLPMQDAAQFFHDIPRAIPEGRDLSRVVWAFLAAELRALPPQEAKIQAVIDPVIAGMDVMASGGAWQKDASADAAYAARARSRTARTTAAYAAYAAAYAASNAAYAAYAASAATSAARARNARAAARKRQAATILALIAAA